MREEDWIFTVYIIQYWDLGVEGIAGQEGYRTDWRGCNWWRSLD